MIVAALMASPASAETGDAARGAIVYQKCKSCHAPDMNRVGPKHRGVFGRNAGSLSDFDYSPALKTSSVIWNDDTLDKWLTDPQAFLPGSKMRFRLGDAQSRADVIAYLKTLN
jgi:cytochrome c